MLARLLARRGVPVTLLEAHQDRPRLSIPWLVRVVLRLPLLRALPTRLVAFGPWKVPVKG
jgi:hypothetical protein